MYRILVIEDDQKICDELSKNIKRWGFDCLKIEDFNNILGTVSQYSPHLILLDINLPFYDGFYWCEKIREFSKVPIIFISSRSTNMDIVMAINMGGDDFVTKPFDLEILMAKMKGLLRRAYSYQDNESGIIEHREVVLNLKNSTVSYKDSKVELTKKEFKILQVLMSGAGRIISKERLMEDLWEADSFIDDNALAVNINRLRKKLVEIGLEDYVQNRKNQGYIIL